MSQVEPFSFSYQASGKIWQIKADLVSNCLALEIRDQLQQVSFAYVNPFLQQRLFEGLSVEGGLLSSLVACQENIVLLQQYSDLENLSDVTTLGLDARQQEVLWAVSDYRHLFFTAKESIGKAGLAGEEESWSAIDLQSGHIRTPSDEEMARLLSGRYRENEANDSLLLPAAYNAGEQHFQTIRQFLEMYLQAEAANTCEYLHVFDKMVISFYTADGEKLANRIAVFDAEGSLLLHRVMEKEVLKPGAETFMVWNRHLFFIENSSCLRGYNLQ